jgi:hypothetical protein
LDLVSGLILALIIILILHLLEEIKTGFRFRLPFGKMRLSMFIGINIGVYLFCAVTLFLSIFGSALVIPLRWIFAIVMILNGLGHIGIMALKRTYFPGGVTAFLLEAVGIVLLVHLIVV